MPVNEHHLRLARPLPTARGVLRERISLLFRHHDGLGEACPLPVYGGEDLVTCREHLQTISHKDMECWLSLSDPWQPWIADLPPLSRFAVLCAGADRLAKAAGMPLHRLYGASSDSCAVNALGEQDAPVIKIKLPADPQAAVQRLSSLPRTSRWRLDLGGSWDSDQTRWFWQECRHLPIEYLEQPLPPGHLQEHAALRRLGCRIALDEDCRSASDAQAIIAANAADVLVLKPALLGGPDRCRACCQLADAAGIGVVITTLLDGAVARRHCAALAIALASPELAQGLGTGSLLASDLPLPPDPIQNWRWQASGPGIGVTLP